MQVSPWGVSDGYHDGSGRWHEANPDTVTAIEQALGVSDANRHEAPTHAGPPPVIATVGQPLTVHRPSDLVLETGQHLRLPAGTTPLPGLNPGYHRLVDLETGADSMLIAAPASCPFPAGLRTWGWALQLYALRRRHGWGMGDLRDLTTLNQWAAGLGAGMVLVNPLHAPAPVISQQPSPYFPASRIFRNLLYLAIEDVPGYGELAADLEPLRARAATANESRRIERDPIFTAKTDALLALFRHTRDRRDDGWEEYRRRGGALARDWGTWCALMEHRPDSWLRWPAEWHGHESPAVAEFRDAHAERVALHGWIQYQLERQLARAGAHLDVMTDLAIGVDRGGFDAWRWPAAFSLRMSVGAPPDEFNTAGQDWGLPPFDPWALRAARYEPWIHTVRAALRHAGALRIDHVMGLFRLWWIPEGAGPQDGCYVYGDPEPLLAIIALEAHRAGAYVVGEDLGTVEDRVREALSGRGVLSYRLLQFEPGPAAGLPYRAVVAVTTHDLPTIAGLLTGSDVEDQEAIGVTPNRVGAEHVRRSLVARAHQPGSPDGPRPSADAQLGAAPGDIPEQAVTDAVVAIYKDLASAPCAVLTATLDDCLGVTERPNMPGTIDEWPNWRIALPVPVEAVMEDPTVLAVAHTLARRTDAAVVSPVP